MMHKFVIAAFYKFADLTDFIELQPNLLEFCKSNNIFGTILLASEGINGTVSGSRENIDSLIKFLQSHPKLFNLEHKESFSDETPFDRMKVRIKKEIVPLGVSGINPALEVGTYVSPEEWNILINDPDVILIDTRNQYECDIGTFKGALDPKTKRFRDFPTFVANNLDPNKNTKVAMFCTGGIRCEKASAFMLKQGFREVYHLKGGILKYLETIPQDQSLWQGECFVFDQRIAVGDGVKVGGHEQCYACRHPVSPLDQESPKYKVGVSCPYCFENLPEKTRLRAIERQKQNELTKLRKNSNQNAI